MLVIKRIVVNAILIEKMTDEIMEAQKEQKESSIKKNQLLKEREILINDLIKAIKNKNLVNKEMKERVLKIRNER